MVSVINTRWPDSGTGEGGGVDFIFNSTTDKKLNVVENNPSGTRSAQLLTARDLWENDRIGNTMFDIFLY